MRNETLNVRLAQILEKRCFFLLLALLALIVAGMFFSGSHYGHLILVIVNVSVFLTAVAAVGRSRLSFVIAVILVLPTLVFRFLALESSLLRYFALSWGLNAVFYLYVLVHLLHYVLRRDLMTSDKLYGSVAAYLLIAIFWAQLHGLIQYFYPGAYALGGTPKDLDTMDLIYFSFTGLTTAGFGDIAPVLIQSRFLTILEMVTGVMYVAILIARLIGIYQIVPKK
jgi:hypothetical protein